MKKFWLGFIVGISGLILGVGAIRECETTQDKKEFMKGWSVGTFVLLILVCTMVGIFVGVTK